MQARVTLPRGCGAFRLQAKRSWKTRTPRTVCSAALDRQQPQEYGTRRQLLLGSAMLGSSALFQWHAEAAANNEVGNYLPRYGTDDFVSFSPSCFIYSAVE